MGKDKDILQNEQLNNEEDQGILFFRDERGEDKSTFSSIYKTASMNNMPKVSPLDALKSSVMRTATEIKKQEAEAPKKEEKKEETSKRCVQSCADKGGRGNV